MSLINILLAVFAFVTKYGPAARPVIESVLSAALASGKISQGVYDAAEAVLDALLGPKAAAGNFAASPTEAEFKALAGL